MSKMCNDEHTILCYVSEHMDIRHIMNNADSSSSTPEPTFWLLLVQYLQGASGSIHAKVYEGKKSMCLCNNDGIPRMCRSEVTTL